MNMLIYKDAVPKTVKCLYIKCFILGFVSTKIPLHRIKRYNKQTFIKKLLQESKC